MLYFWKGIFSVFQVHVESKIDQLFRITLENRGKKTLQVDVLKSFKVY